MISAPGLSTVAAEVRKGIFQAITFPQTTDTITWDSSQLRNEHSLPSWTFEDIQQTRIQPTVVLAKAAVSATLLAAAWTTRTLPQDQWVDVVGIKDTLIVDEIERYVARYILPLRSVVSNLVSGIFDYGYAPYEKILAYDASVDLVYIKHLKPLLQEFSEVLVDGYGELRGVRNRAPIQYTIAKHSPLKDADRNRSQGLRSTTVSGAYSLPNVSVSAGQNDWLYWPTSVGRGFGYVDLDLEHSAWFSMDVEGQNWYGRSLVANVIECDRDWRSTMKDLRKYHGKIAGSQMIVRYPVGTTLWNGVDYDNREIALEVAKQLQQNNVVIMPIESSDALETQLVGGSGNLAKGAWSIEGVDGEVSVNRSDYLSVLQYLDALCCRGMMVPERAVLEAQYGSKADAERHTESFTAILQSKLDQILHQWNHQIVDPMIALNFGSHYVGLVSVDAAPITDAALDYLKGLYSDLLTQDTDQSKKELGLIDYANIRERIGVPSQLQVEQIYGSEELAANNYRSPQADSFYEIEEGASESLGDETA